jgi:Ca2+-binding EF-hand superfamily protein
MVINSMSSAYPNTEQMTGMGRRPSPAEMFNRIDENGSGGLDQVELSDLATKLSEMTGEDVDAEDLLSEYDTDQDGQLSEEETQALMDDHRPEGPPPGGMGAVQGPPPDLSQLFSDADEDDDGSLKETEAQGIADMISDATGEDLAVEDLMAAYDEDGDGVLSQEETLDALEANRPEGPPLSPETDTEDPAIRSWSQAGSIENYGMMANLATDQNPSSVLEMLGGESLASSGARFSVNTIV